MSKKILLVCSGGFIGGAEILMLELKDLFIEHKYEVSFILNQRGELHDAVENSSLRNISPVLLTMEHETYFSKFNPFPFFLNLFRIWKVLRKYSPDVILVEGKLLTQLLAPLGYLLNLKVISYVHFPISDYEAKRVFYNLVYKIVLCAEGLRRYFQNSKASNDSFVVIRNAIDAEKFYPVKSKKNIQGILKDSFVITLVGHLSKVKGQEYALRALAKLKDLGHNVHLLFVGADNDPSQANLKYLKTLASQLQVDSNVIFLGKLENVLEIYHSSDVLLLPSSQEGLPLVVLEAMACALPVVATSVDGTPDAVIDGETGFLLDIKELESGNVGILVEKIEHLLQDRELREKMSKKAREVVLEQFSKTKYKSEFLDLIKNS